MQGLTNTSNPYMRKIIVGGADQGGSFTTYGGVSVKLLFFFLCTGIGVAFYYIFPFSYQYSDVVLIGAAGIAIVTSIMCYAKPSTTPVAGTIFTLSQGYIVGYVCKMYTYLYYGIVPLALFVTFTVVLAMLILYGTGIIKVGKRFRAVVSTLFFASIMIGLITFISSFFTPVLANLLYGDTIFGLLISIAFVVIATLNLAVDFDNIVYGVKNRTEKKYEWVYAFGLATTVIILFVRILSLIARLKN